MAAVRGGQVGGGDLGGVGHKQKSFWSFPNAPGPEDQREEKWSEVKSLSRVQLFATPWTVAYQDPPSMGFSWQEYWSGLPVPFPKVAPKDNSLLTVYCHPGKENRLLLTRGRGHFKLQNKPNGWNSIMWQMVILLLSLFVF